MMVNTKIFVNNLKKLLSSKKRLYSILGGILGIICFIFFMKSCSISTVETSYTIGLDGRWVGLQLTGKERNLTAFNVSLLRAIAKKENVRVQTDITSKLIGDLEEGKLQGIITNLQPTPLTESRFIFSNPYFLLGPVLIIRSSAPTTGWNEIGKKIVGVQYNAPTLLNLEQDPTIQLKLYRDILKALADLSERRIDGVVFPAITAHTYINTFYSHELQIVTPPLNNEGLRLVTLKNKEGENLVQIFNEGLGKLKQEGSYAKLLDQWGFVDVEQIKEKKTN